MFLLTLLAALTSVIVASPTIAPARRSLDGLLSQTISSGCSTSGTASCTNTTAISNTCCFESPGGLLVLTQFWDTNPSTGPSNSWTIHGLWPDHCDGSFDQNCDPSRDYTNIANLLTSQGASSTLSVMQMFWVDINGNDETFWEHEWSTHGTCYSTLRRSCLPSGSPTGAEAVAFFQTVVRLFQAIVQSFNIFGALQAAGITPSSTATHTLSSLQSALQTAFGVTPAFDCSSGAVNQAYIYFHLKGSVIDGAFVPINAPRAGSCPSTNIKYPLKSGTPTTTTVSHASQTGLPATATIRTLTSSGIVGGLLTLGTWSTQTLATMTLSGSPSGFTMTSSKGPCAVSGGSLNCGSGVTPSTFTAVSSGGNTLLAFGGSSSWTSDGVPSGTTVFTVFSGSSHAQDYQLVIT
ncbi:hypothetical protein AMATHDRAFT_140301 [Amanita thiersii Skay4041]|uniref:Ribonuclease T2-like n=1 Tax=Amanita thiersii Skay4041 TaxID=703135 RepID=A0A2A9NWZ2_9AGAR|nr:hypothetical protein AMATHDRAFT_140301 [Amanita thiersii Skay4041]